MGLKVEEGVLKIKPCIPKEWDEYYVRYEYKRSSYNIKVRNLSKEETNVVRSFKVNGEEIEEKSVKLIDNGRIYEVEVEI